MHGSASACRKMINQMMIVNAEKSATQVSLSSIAEAMRNRIDKATIVTVINRNFLVIHYIATAKNSIKEWEACSRNLRDRIVLAREGA